jgi:hypothetical protein
LTGEYFEGLKAMYWVSGKLFLVLLIFSAAVFLTLFHTSARSIDQIAASLTAPVEDYSQNVANAKRQFVEERIKRTETLLIRDISPPTGTLEERHKLRWLYKTLETEMYRIIENKISSSTAIYVWILHYTLWIAIALLFIILTCVHIYPGLTKDAVIFVGVAFYAYVAFVTLSGMEEEFTYIETATIAAGLYFALRGRFFMFLVVLFVSVANRETGVALGAVYSVINWRQVRYWWSPVFIGGAFLLGINVDLLSDPDFYNPRTFAGGHLGRPSIQNFLSYPSETIGFVLELSVIFSPLLFIFWRHVRDKIIVPLLVLLGIYGFILIFGTYIGNIFPYLLLAPLLIALVVRSYYLKNEESAS